MVTKLKEAMKMMNMMMTSMNIATMMAEDAGAARRETLDERAVHNGYHPF